MSEQKKQKNAVLPVYHSKRPRIVSDPTQALINMNSFSQSEVRV